MLFVKQLWKTALSPLHLWKISAACRKAKERNNWITDIQFRDHRKVDNRQYDRNCRWTTIQPKLRKTMN